MEKQTPEFRELGHYQFRDGSVLRITLSGAIPTAEALDMIEALVEVRRAQLVAMHSRSSDVTGAT